MHFTQQELGEYLHSGNDVAVWFLETFYVDLRHAVDQIRASVVVLYVGDMVHVVNWWI